MPLKADIVRKELDLMGVKFDSLAASLKRERKKRGLTQEQFAEEFGVSLATARNWEQGKTYPEADTLERLCDYYKCDMDYLFGRISCRTHDAQFVCDYTGLDEYAVENLHGLLKDDSATMVILNHLIRSDVLLNKLVNYYASMFEPAAKSHPFSLIPYDHRRIQIKLAYADILDALPKDTGTFFYAFQNDPNVTRQMVFRLIWGCVDNDQAIELLQLLYDHRLDIGNSSQLGMIAEFLASDSYYVDFAKRLGFRLEDFFCTEQEEIEDGTD